MVAGLAKIGGASPKIFPAMENNFYPVLFVVGLASMRSSKVVE